MSMRVTVVHIITKLELGGAQQNTLFTVGHLSQNKFHPVLIVGEKGFLDEEGRTLQGVDFYQIPTLVRPIRPFSDGRALLSLTLLLLKIKPDIVHTHSSKAGILGRMAAWLARVPVIIHSVHGFGFTPIQHPWMRQALIILERLISKCTTRVFTVSEANQQLGISLGLFTKEQSTVIRSGIDLEAFRTARIDREAKERELGFQAGHILVGMVGALKPQKAPLDFVRLADHVHQSFPEVRFLLVGDGELRQAVEREITRLKLGEVMQVVGWRRDIPEIMKCLDVLVLPSLWEGLPRVYVEALAAGVPVVGTRVDGAAEVIKDGVNGYLVEAGDVQALADRVKTLLRFPEKRLQMKRHGSGLSAEFDIREMVRRQEQEYEHLAAACRTH